MRKITCLLLLLCLLPSFALADKTITLTFTGDITLGCEVTCAPPRTASLPSMSAKARVLPQKLRGFLCRG